MWASNTHPIPSCLNEVQGLGALGPQSWWPVHPWAAADMPVVRQHCLRGSSGAEELGAPVQPCAPAPDAPVGLQDCLRGVIRGVGGLEHADFRAFHNERRSGEMRSFIDGDLVEQARPLLWPHRLTGPVIQSMRDLTRRNGNEGCDQASDAMPPVMDLGLLAPHGKAALSLVAAAQVVTPGAASSHETHALVHSLSAGVHSWNRLTCNHTDCRQGRPAGVGAGQGVPAAGCSSHGPRHDA